jgi:imidazolonepropionase-like amidohydrolase
MILEKSALTALLPDTLESCLRLNPSLCLTVGGRIAARGNVLQESGPAVLLIEGERIAAILEAASLPADWREKLQRQFPNATHADFSRAIAAPGLVEGHAHLFLDNGKCADMSDAEMLERALRHARACREQGVFWVRDCGDPFNINLRARETFSISGLLPSIRACGAAIHRRKRYGKQLGIAVEDEAGLIEAARQRIEAGVDDVKLVLSGIVSFEKEEVPGDPQFSEESVRTVVKMAHDAGRRVVVHASGDKAAALAARAGVDTIEHAYFVSEQSLEAMIKNQVTWLPTLAPVYVQWRDAAMYGHSDATRQALERILKGHAKSIARGAELGVRIAGGSDSGSPGVGHGPGAALEFQLMAEHGLSTAQAYAAASLTGAAFTGFQPHPGVENGAPAHFALLNKSPLQYSRAFEHLAAVVTQGRLSVHAPHEEVCS